MGIGDFGTAPCSAPNSFLQRLSLFLLLSTDPAMKYARYLKGVDSKAPLVFQGKFIE